MPEEEKRGPTHHDGGYRETVLGFSSPSVTVTELVHAAYRPGPEGVNRG